MMEAEQRGATRTRMVAAYEACKSLRDIDVRMTAGERGPAIAALIDVALFQARIALGKSKVCRDCCSEIREPQLRVNTEERCATCVIDAIRKEDRCESR